MSRKNEGKYKDLSSEEKKQYHLKAYKKWRDSNKEKQYSYYKSWVKENRKKLNEWYRDYFSVDGNRLKRNARNELNNAILYGKIKRKNCEVCGCDETQGHHENYNRPLDINWLCRSCHTELHKKQWQ
jgi:hypothetical protein